MGKEEYHTIPCEPSHMTEVDGKPAIVSIQEIDGVLCDCTFFDDGTPPIIKPFDVNLETPAMEKTG